ncbi:MAG: signal peptidase I [Agathobacter sp.]|nr:signal peptidase I [Agathobacter sp.]
MKKISQHKIEKKIKKKKKTEEVNKLLDYDEESEFSEDLKIRELRQELRRVKYNYRFISALYSTVGTMLVVAAVAVLIANLWLPVLQVTGASMSPTLEEGQVLLANKGSSLDTGDIIAFYYNNKILVKRVIAVAGDWVYIAEDGTVYVNDIAIDEPYLTDKAFGNCNIEMPYQVPESQIFVMGDHRSVSLDSRNTTIGCISEEQILGKVYYCLWPLNSFGKIK